MQIIIPMQDRIRKILGVQKRKDGKYRLHAYCLQCDVDDGVLIYNSMTCEMIRLTAAEAEEMTESQELIERWFLVPEGNDDYKTAKQLRTVYEMTMPGGKYVNSYTVMTTTDCNARCFYCYEAGWKKHVPMSEDTARALTDYIERSRSGKRVNLTWFGGEPLFNEKVIDMICGGLKARDISYASKMITNGYLFGEEQVRKAKELWNLKYVQITLDGTEEIYNRSKSYIYPDEPSPYRVVLKNIERIAEAGIGVHIRLNYDLDNAEDIMTLIGELHARFGESKNVNVYTHSLYDLDHRRTAVETEALLDWKKRLDEKIAGFGYQYLRPLNRFLPVNQCMADNAHSLLVAPDGRFTCCEHHSEDEIIGSIRSEEMDAETIRRWKERVPEQPVCRECPIYPQCVQIRMCPGEKCEGDQRDSRTENCRKAMREEYDRYLKNDGREMTAEDQEGSC